jgi:hypothetical protein
MTAFLLFVAGLATFVFAWLKKTAKHTALLDALEAKAKAAAASVEKNQAIAVAAETHAAEVKESVSARLAKLEQDDATVREQDSVDIANEVIRRN